MGQSRRLYVSATKESTFGTAAALTHVLDHPSEFGRLEVTTEKIDNNRYASGAVDFPTAHLPVSYRLTGDLSVWASLESLGIFFAKAMGGDTKAGAGPYTHTLDMTTLPFFLDGMTIQENCAGVAVDSTYDTIHKGVCVDSVELRIGSTGLAMVNVGLLGSGINADGSTQTESGLTKPSFLIAAPKVRIAYDAALSEGVSPWDGGHEVSATAGTFPTIDSGASDLSAYIDSFSLKLSNGGTQARSAGSSTTTGIYAGQAFTENREVMVEFTAHLGTSTANWLRALVESTAAAQREYAFILDIAGGTDGYGAQFVVPLATMDSNPDGGSGTGPQMYTFRFRGRKSTSWMPLEVYIANADNFDYC